MTDIQVNVEHYTPDSDLKMANNTLKWDKMYKKIKYRESFYNGHVKVTTAPLIFVL